MADNLIFNKWETGQFILSIWTRADGVVEQVEIRLRPSSPFAGRCRCGGVTRQNLERALLTDAEMVDAVEVGGRSDPPIRGRGLPE